jgi:hypothetical protein
MKTITPDSAPTSEAKPSLEAIQPSLESIALSSQKKKKSLWEYLARILLILLGVFVGFIVALFIGFATGLLSIDC